MHLYSKVVHELSAVDFEASFVVFVADAESHSAAKHHLGRSHIIIHAVLQIRHKCLLIDEVEVNEFFGGYLDSYITFNKEDKTGDPNLMVLDPARLFGNPVYFLFEKEYSLATPGNESFTVDEDHLPKVEFCHSFDSVIF